MNDHQSSVKRRLPGWAKTVLAYIGGIITALLTLFLTNWLSLGESDLVYVGGEPPAAPTNAEVKVAGREIFFYVRIQPKLKNRGFKSGHVDSVEIKPVGLTPAPERVEVTFLDRKPLRIWETREIRCDFVAVIRFRFPDDPPEANQGYTTYEPGSTPPAADAMPPIEFGASFRGPDGRLIHWQATQIHMEVTPGSPPRTPQGRTP